MGLGKEDYLQQAVVSYVKMQHGIDCIPCNTESKRSPFEQMKFKTLGGRAGMLDLFVPAPSLGYHGLFMELKAEGVTVFNIDGSVRKNETVQKQNKEINRLMKLGYYATFAIGWDECKKIIDDYFS